MAIHMPGVYSFRERGTEGGRGIIILTSHLPPALGANLPLTRGVAVVYIPHLPTILEANLSLTRGVAGVSISLSHMLFGGATLPQFLVPTSHLRRVWQWSQPHFSHHFRANILFAVTNLSGGNLVKYPC